MSQPAPRRIPIAPSRRSTLGVEWEMLLVDKDSGETRQCARAVLDAVKDEHTGSSGVVGELLQNTVELVTGVCGTVTEAGRDLSASLQRVREVTEPLRVDLTSAGTHPFSRWAEQMVTDAGRYNTLIDRTQWWGRQMTIYGLHVHVGVEDPAKLIPITNAMLAYAGHLLCLSASSPYWQGEATRYASNRSLLFQQLPTAGLPFRFEDWSGYERYVEDMLTMGVIDHINEIRWDLRPVPHFGTVEVRVADAVPTLTEVLAFAALTQCLVEDISTRMDRGEEIENLSPWQVAENKWRAARYGMDAILVLDRQNREELVTDDLEALLERLAPVADRLGCAEQLEGIRLIMDRGASYQRQLAVAEQDGTTFRDVVSHLVRETREDALLLPGR
ncbi:MAG: glutamate--cysteine ligase [Brachybacterium sp.]|nr:glutamate--cysteine ligase [Brachybacterium sp.]